MSSNEPCEFGNAGNDPNGCTAGQPQPGDRSNYFVQIRIAPHELDWYFAGTLTLEA